MSESITPGPSRRQVLTGLLGAGAALMTPTIAYGQTLLEGEATQQLRIQEALKQEIAELLRQDTEAALTEAGTRYLESMSDTLKRYREHMEQSEWPALTVNDFPFPEEPADDPFYVNFAHPLLLRGANKTAVQATYTRHWEGLKSWHVFRLMTSLETTSKELTEEALPAYLRSGDLGKIPHLISKISHDQAELIEIQSAVLRFPNEEPHNKGDESRSTRYRFEIQEEWRTVEQQSPTDQLLYLGRKLREYTELIRSTDSPEEQNDLINAVLMLTGWMSDLNENPSEEEAPPDPQTPIESENAPEEIATDPFYASELHKGGSGQTTVPSPDARSVEHYDPSIFEFFERTFWLVVMEQFQLEIEADHYLTEERYNRGETAPGETFDGIAAFQRALEVAKKQLSKIDIDMIYDQLKPEKREAFYFEHIGRGYQAVTYNRPHREYPPQEARMMSILAQQSYQLEMPTSLEGERTNTVRRIFKALDENRPPKRHKREGWEEGQARTAFFQGYYGQLWEASEKVSYDEERGHFNPKTSTVRSHGNFGARPELHQEHRVLNLGYNYTYEQKNVGLHPENIDAFLLALAGHEVARQR